MFIKHIEINGFGNLSNEKIDLTNGINIVYGPNESGKSTLQGFIFNMLFGMARSRGKASRTDDFVRYEPIGASGIYRGSMTFEAGDREYTLVRDFAAGGRNDRLISASDKVQTELLEGSLADILDGIDKKTYMNTKGVAQGAEPDEEYIRKKIRDRYISNESGERQSPIVSRTLETLEKERKETAGRVRTIKKASDEELERLSAKIELLKGEIRDKKAELSELAEDRDTYYDEYEEPEREQKKSYAPCIVTALIAAFLFTASFVFDRYGKYLLIAAGVALAAVALSAVFFKRRTKDNKYDTENKYHNKEKEQRRLFIKEIITEKEKLLSMLRSEYDKTAKEGKEADGNAKRLSAIMLAEKRIIELSGKKNVKFDKRFRDKIEYNYLYLTGQDGVRLMFGENNEISILKNDEVIPFWQSSRGTRDLIQLSERLAAAEMIVSGEQMPILLDDAFVNFDDDRLKRALIFLSNKKQQVILFTCQKREKNILDELMVAYREVKWSGSDKLAGNLSFI